LVQEAERIDWKTGKRRGLRFEAFLSQDSEGRHRSTYRLILNLKGINYVKELLGGGKGGRENWPKRRTRHLVSWGKPNDWKKNGGKSYGDGGCLEKKQ